MPESKTGTQEYLSRLISQNSIPHALHSDAVPLSVLGTQHALGIHMSPLPGIAHKNDFILLNSVHYFGISLIDASPEKSLTSIPNLL